MTRAILHRKLSATLIVLMSIAVLTIGLACSSSEPEEVAVEEEVMNQQEEVAVATQAPIEDQGPKDTIVFADLNWESAEIQTRIASYIIENGYEYPTEKVIADTTSQFPAFASDSVHISMEVWVTNAEEAYAQAIDNGDVIDVSPTLEDNWQAWVIPQYVKDANPGLVSVSDIPEYKDLFVTPDSNGKARLVSCVPGWACERINANKIAAYGLEDDIEVITPGSGGALFADLQGAYDREVPWLGYIWAPTKLASELDLYLLEEPPYTDECWTSDQGCAYPTAEIKVVVTPSLQERAPEVVDFLSNWNMPSSDAGLVEAWMKNNNETPEAASIWFLQNHANKWTGLVPSDIAGKVNEALADERVTQAPIEDQGPKDTIVFADLNWESAEIQTRIASYIIENGYEYPTEKVIADTTSQFPAFASDSVHISMEVWVTNAEEAYAQAIDNGDVIDVSPTLEDNWQAWVIPQYVKDANPGLVSVSDIPEYKDLFVTPDSNGKARLVSCVPGWACERINANKIAAYGLEDDIEVITPGSGGALFADLQGAYDREVPWLGYIWAPTKLASELDLYLLEEPPYTDECWTSDQGCAYPTAEIKVVVTPSLQERAPEVVDFLSNWNMPSSDAGLVEAWMKNNNETPEAASIWFLQNHADKWTGLVPSDIADKVNEALADEN